MKASQCPTSTVPSAAHGLGEDCQEQGGVSLAPDSGLVFRKGSKPIEDLAGRARKGAELPPRGGAMGKGDCTGKTAPWEGHRPPRGIPDAVDTGSISIKTHFKPPWTVALRFCSISCLGYKSTLSFVPEMGPSCRQNS